MNRDWRDFKSTNTNLAGAREAFENACETLFRKIYSNQHVSQVSVKKGDGGIDIFVGEIGIEPITVIQCKFFLDTFEESQKSQIRESFDTAVKSTKYVLKEWILCIPRVIDIDESSWWSTWKNKKTKEHNQSLEFIKLKNGNELIDLMKEHDIYNQIFNIEDSLKLDDIHKKVSILTDKILPNKTTINEVNPNIVIFNNYSSINEPYYQERPEDTCFIETLKISNLWVFGKSGKGKTALINRNLIKNEREYLFCDLSPITISESKNVFDEIICSIEDKFSVVRCDKENNVIKIICKLIKSCNLKKEIVIVIDELFISDL
jgi:Cdc6-like AAA superfamily ATPase